MFATIVRGLRVIAQSFAASANTIESIAKSALTMVMALWISGTAANSVHEFAGNCLFAVTVGAKATPVTPCTDSDPLDLANNPDVQKAMQALGIPFSRVRFKGCDKQGFAAYPPASESSGVYIVTYPSEQKTAFLAPVLHELAHVMQMEVAGGLVQLTRKYKLSKRIELGADYLTGVIFAKYFPDTGLKAFEQNLLLMGLFYEADDRAHGTPVERTNAFRLGAFRKPIEINIDFRKVSEEFQRDIYGEVVTMSR